MGKDDNHKAILYWDHRVVFSHCAGLQQTLREAGIGPRLIREDTPESDVVLVINRKRIVGIRDIRRYAEEYRQED